MSKFTELHEACSELPALYSQDGVVGDLPAVYIFMPGGTGTWILWEYDPKDHIAHGMCDLGFPEMGDVSLEELAGVTGQLGLRVEVEKWTHTRFAGMKLAGIPIPDYLERPVGIEEALEKGIPDFDIPPTPEGRTYRIQASVKLETHWFVPKSELPTEWARLRQMASAHIRELVEPKGYADPDELKWLSISLPTLEEIEND